MIQPGYRERQDARVALQARQQIEYCEQKEAERMARGRLPNHAAQAKELMKALNFISVASNKVLRPTDDHCMLVDRWALMTDGQVSAGHPIDEDIGCCPHLEKLKAAVNRCGKSLALAHLDSNRLSVRGDKLRVLVPCLTFDEMPDVEADQNIHSIDNTVSEAMLACAVLADEKADNVIAASIRLEANVCTGTNRKTMLQYYHGHNLPPALIVPKLFSNAVGKAVAREYKIVGFGFNPSTSITIHFEGGAWIKTLLYVDPWPDPESIFAGPEAGNIVDVPEGLFEGIGAIEDFSDSGEIFFMDQSVSSHVTIEANGSATFDVPGLKAGKHIKAEDLLKFQPFTTKLDYMSWADRILTFGDKSRGVIATMLPGSDDD